MQPSSSGPPKPSNFQIRWSPTTSTTSVQFSTSQVILKRDDKSKPIKRSKGGLKLLNIQGLDRGAQYQYLVIDSIPIILFPFLSIPISISIISKRSYQYQYLINFSQSSLINVNINLCYQCPPMILLRLPISYQLVIVINVNIDIN